MTTKKTKELIKTGRTIEQVQAEDFPIEKLPDLKKTSDKVRNLYSHIDDVEAKSKLEIYKLLLQVYRNRDRLLEENLAKHFSKYIESLGVNKSTAYKDARVIEFIEFHNLEKQLTLGKVKDLVGKLKELAYLPEETVATLLPQLADLTRDDIRDAGPGRETIPFIPHGKIAGLKYQRNQANNTVTIKTNNSALSEAFIKLLERLRNPADLADVLRALDKKIKRK